MVLSSYYLNNMEKPLRTAETDFLNFSLHQVQDSFLKLKIFYHNRKSFVPVQKLMTLNDFKNKVSHIL